MNASDIRFATIRELAAGLRKRRFSAVELAQCALELLERVGPHYNAVAALMPERALAEAKRADAALKRGQAMAGTRDGVLASTVDLRTASASLSRVVWAKSWSVAGSHVIRIRNLATAMHPSASVDAFVVLR